VKTALNSEQAPQLQFRSSLLGLWTLSSLFVLLAFRLFKLQKRNHHHPSASIVNTQISASRNLLAKQQTGLDSEFSGVYISTPSNSMPGTQSLSQHCAYQNKTLVSSLATSSPPSHVAGRHLIQSM